MEISTTLSQADAAARAQDNLRLARRLALIALGMVGFGFAMVPMYNVFCELTGLNGKTNVAPAVVDANTQVDYSRQVKVEFLSHTMPGIGLSFKAEAFSLKVHPGEISRMNYTITNHGSRTFVGQAVPSITPALAAQHFEKLECFCFSQQTFGPGETRTFPVVFVVNPKLDRDFGTVTLSYTFFEAPKPKS
ncbi:MAG: cytochrome c oxidase assembly protein [Rhodoferax sp.]